MWSLEAFASTRMGQVDLKVVLGILGNVLSPCGSEEAIVARELVALCCELLRKLELSIAYVDMRISSVYTAIDGIVHVKS